MLRPSPNHGTQRLPNDDDDDEVKLTLNLVLFVCKKLGYQMMLTYLFSKLLVMTAFHKGNLAVKKGGYLYT